MVVGVVDGGWVKSDFSVSLCPFLKLLDKHKMDTELDKMQTLQIQKCRQLSISDHDLEL